MQRLVYFAVLLLKPTVNSFLAKLAFMIKTENILRPYFFDENLNGVGYLQFLQNDFHLLRVVLLHDDLIAHCFSKMVLLHIQFWRSFR